MANRYVDVSITRETQPTTQAAFGLALILSFDKDAAYKEYTDIAVVGVDYGTDSNTYKLAQAILSQTPRVDKVAILGSLATEGTTPMTDITADLDTLRKTQDVWYYLVCTGHADATITALSSWNEANGKFYFASTSNKTLAGTLNAERTAILVHNNPASYPAEAWVGVGAPKDVGSFTWTFKTLNGIDPTTYSTADVTTIEAGKASTYVKIGGVNITTHGVTTSGEYIDIIQGQDYIISTLTENVFSLLVNEDKVPYTTGGIAMVVAEITRTLNDAADMDIIAKDENNKPIFTVDVPDIDDISDTDKANRYLPNLNWSAVVAGAVEDVGINGTLTLS